MTADELRAALANGLDDMAAHLASGDRTDVIAAAADVLPSLRQTLASTINAALRATALVIAGATRDNPIPASAGESAALLCGATAQALRHISAAIDLARYDQRMLLSESASVFAAVHVQFAGPLRHVVAYASLDAVYGSSLSSSAMGGRPPSPLRNTNAFQALLDEVARLPFVISSGAAHALAVLIASDPALYPLSPDAVSSFLADVGNGTRTVAA